MYLIVIEGPAGQVKETFLLPVYSTAWRLVMISNIYYSLLATP